MRHEEALLHEKFGIDYEEYTRLLRSSRRWYYQKEGFDRRYYKLAIGVTGLRRNLWRNGTVYALPPDTFEHWNEWTSRTPVRPVLRLAVTPDDLSLRDDVWGNDYRMFSYGAWVELGKDAFPFLKDARATPIHPAGQPPWLRQL